MALTDRLMDNLRIKLPGAIDAAIKLELWNCLNEFCRTGRAWRETIDVTLTEGDSTYQPTPTGTEIIEVYGISHLTLDVSCAVFKFGELTLTTAPTVEDAASPLFLDCAMTPALDAGDDIENLIPADMWSEHFDAILNGVLYRMMAQAAKPYSNTALAAFHRRVFRDMMFEARQKVRTQGVPGAQMWRFPKWA